MTQTTDTDRTGRDRSPLERHVQSILLVLVMALLGWVGSTLVKLTTSVAVIETQMGTFNAQMSGTYRTSDAQRDMADINRQLDDVRRRTDKLEREREKDQERKR